MKQVFPFAAAIMLASTTPALADASSTNNTGKDANDFHLILSDHVKCFVLVSVVPCKLKSDPWGKSDSLGDDAGDGNVQYNFKGTKIPNGGSITFPGYDFKRGSNLTVQGATWTFDEVEIGVAKFSSPKFIGEKSFQELAIEGWGLVAVPEAPTWTMMIAGFGMVGAAMRRRSPAAA